MFGNSYFGSDVFMYGDGSNIRDSMEVRNCQQCGEVVSIECYDVEADLCDCCVEFNADDDWDKEWV